MKNISLLKVSILVVTAAFASNFVNAEDRVNNTKLKSQLDASKITNKVKQVSFPTLIKTLDTDKNGMLSEKEIAADKAQLFQAEFTKVDLNKNKQIDEIEFNKYFTAIESKVSAVTKTAF